MKGPSEDGFPRGDGLARRGWLPRKRGDELGQISDVIIQAWLRFRLSLVTSLRRTLTPSSRLRTSLCWVVEAWMGQYIGRLELDWPKRAR